MNVDMKACILFHSILSSILFTIKVKKFHFWLCIFKTAAEMVVIQVSEEFFLIN